MTASGHFLLLIRNPVATAPGSDRRLCRLANPHYLQNPQNTSKPRKKAFKFGREFASLIRDRCKYDDLWYLKIKWTAARIDGQTLLWTMRALGQWDMGQTQCKIENGKCKMEEKTTSLAKEASMLCNKRRLTLSLRSKL